MTKCIRDVSNFLQMFQMLLTVLFAYDDDVINITGNTINLLKYGVQGMLKHGKCGDDAEREMAILVQLYW